MVRVGLPKKNPKVLKPAFTIPPKLLQSLVEDPKWDDKGSITQNYNSFGVVNDPNSLTDSLRAPPSVSDDPNDSGSDLEEDDLKSALGKRRRDGKSALPQPLTSIQRLYISRLVEKYGADFQRMMMDIKLNPMQHSVATLEKLYYKLPVVSCAGKFDDALQKYKLAKENIKEIPSFQSRKLLLACSLNLMACYLKTRQYDEFIKEGSEVLAYDAKNLKDLYRRGQAYKERGLLRDVVTNLSNALEVSPDDDIIGELLRDTKEQLIKEGGHCAPGRLVIEEITEEVENVPSGNNRNSSTEQTIDQPKKSGDSSKSYNIANNGNLKSNSDNIDTLKKDPEAIRSFQNFISKADPATLASLNIGQSQDVSPDMIKASSDMIGKMSPEELQKMFDMASSFQGNNPFLRGGSSDSPFNSGSVPPNVTPDMLKTATDMISKMPPDDLKKMFEMASLMKGKESIPSAAAVDKKGRNLSQSNFPSSSTTRAFGESSFSDNAFSNIINASEPNFPSSSTDLQEQMRNQMKDPAMRHEDGCFVGKGDNQIISCQEHDESPIRSVHRRSSTIIFGYIHRYIVCFSGSCQTTSMSIVSRSTSSSAESEQIKEMQEEINALKENNSKIDELTQAIIFLTQRDKARTKEIELLMQMQNFSGRQGLESPADGRRSSESSYRIGDNGTSGGTN
ncbi:unnamed protein product [Vicia faba]|uniref:Uncharacterized protein n=1 Tax=Vicia faba TaxID=3906 RepID=A0AAV1ARB3_VICFA|nr:unnamed protein product [Vicia faba]